jgi:hypothetical protein
MDAPTRGATRLARAAAFGVATLALACCAHVAGGGVLPSMTILATLAVPVTMVALALTGRRCGPLLLLGSMTAAQVLLHESLSALTAQAAGGMAGHVPAASAAVGGHVMAHAGGWPVTMTAAHVIATVVTALVLARGEQALWQLVSRFLPALPGEPVLVACRPLQRPALFSVPALAPSAVTGGPGLRGPPARFVAAA